jgi:hypothetical protein
LKRWVTEQGQSTIFSTPVIDILLDKTLKSKHSYYSNKNGKFEIAPFIANTKRQTELLETTIALSDKALNIDTRK